MKILLLCSSPRQKKSQTFLLAEEVLRGISLDPRDCDVFHLCDFRIEFCRHCEICHRRIMHCPVQDDVHMILEKMLRTDGLIIASPNYINQVTASMKALFDRSSHFIHCKLLMGKYIAGVVSSGSGRDKPVLDYIKYYGHMCGAQYTGGVSSSVPVSKEKMEEAFSLGKALRLDIEKKRRYRDQLEIIEQGRQHFKNVMEKRKEDWVEEYQYWQRMGWL